MPPITQPDDDISEEELALRKRCIDAIERYWPELAPQIRGWLGSAFDEDEGWSGEVVFVMLRRAREGKGVVAPLRPVPEGDPHEKGIVFANARFVTAEVVRKAVKDRQAWRSTLRDDSAFDRESSADD